MSGCSRVGPFWRGSVRCNRRKSVGTCWVLQRWSWPVLFHRPMKNAPARGAGVLGSRVAPWLVARCSVAGSVGCAGPGLAQHEGHRVPGAPGCGSVEIHRWFGNDGRDVPYPRWKALNRQVATQYHLGLHSAQIVGGSGVGVVARDARWVAVGREIWRRAQQRTTDQREITAVLVEHQVDVLQRARCARRGWLAGVILYCESELVKRRGVTGREADS